jgi:hypothetical protein
VKTTNPLAALALTLGLAAPGAVLASNDLFSEVAVEAVFAEATPAATAATNTGAPAALAADRRVTGAAVLTDLLESNGLDAKRIDGKTASASFAYAGWTFPTTLRVDVDREEVAAAMSLATLPEANKWQSEKLVDLLSTGVDAAGAHFTYQASDRQLLVRRTIGARGVSGDSLGRVLREMAELAIAHQASWASTSKTTGGAAAVPPATLVGSWIATLGQGEAFALRVATDSKFGLAHVRSGKTTTSTGKVERSGDQLTLVGSTGSRLSGTVAGATDAGFDLTLATGRKLSFKKSPAR